LRRFFGLDQRVFTELRTMKNPVLRLDRNLYEREDLVTEMMDIMNEMTGFGIERGQIVDEDEYQRERSMYC
jgi:hypothetical protein